MTQVEFWEVIRSTRRRDATEHVERLVAKLAKRPADEIVAFGRWWARLHGKAYSWRLWAAAYLMNGGCSDDGFIDFRSWLILQGEAIYAAALKDPETLAAVRVEPDEAACECYPAEGAYRRATGGDADAYWRAVESKGPLALGPDEPAHRSWDFDFDDQDLMRKRLPRLHKKFSDA